MPLSNAHATAPTRPGDTENALVEIGLQCSAYIYQFATTQLESMTGETATVAVTKSDIKKIRKAARKMNHTLTQHTHACYAREDRLTVELHLLKNEMDKECTDRESHLILNQPRPDPDPDPDPDPTALKN
jgi:hypothetical protein